MKAGEKYLVEVHGWIMCKGVESVSIELNYPLMAKAYLKD